MKNFRKTITSLLMTAAIISCSSNDDPAPPEPTTVAVTGVTLNTPTLSLVRGRTETLTATVAPENATNKNVSWTTSNAQVATVSNGTVTAVAIGTATITVTTADGNRTAACALTVTNPEYDVYVAGTIMNSGNAFPAYWKNGAVTQLNIGSALSGSIRDIAVTPNGDVHILSIELVQEGVSTYNIYSKYWKNGTATQIGVVNEAALKMDVAGNDVHIVGYGFVNNMAVPKYWKNGVDQNLGSGSLTNVMPTDISVFGGKYYICGVAGIIAGTEKSVIWNNSTTPTEFVYDPGQGEQVYFTVLNSIFAYGDNQYNLGGYSEYQSNVRKRDAFINSSARVGIPDDESTITAVYAYDDKLYGAGYLKLPNGGPFAAFMMKLQSPMLTLSTNNAQANCIFVNETGEYVGGNENGVAVYWKDGVKQSLSGAGNGSDVFAICVAERP
jgi:hypothetical protein